MHCSEHHKIVLYFSLGLVVPFVLASKLALRHTEKQSCTLVHCIFLLGLVIAFVLASKLALRHTKLEKQSCTKAKVAS